MDSRESERSQEDEKIEELGSQGDLLSSPRHSELSLISDATGEQ